jgi:hypothetical protein
MRPAALLAHRLAAQRISSTAFTRPEQLVSWLGAVQAQDYLGALWAVGLRVAASRERDVERALADRSIVRTWPMRGTLHFVAAADARWMTELLAPKVLARAAGRFRALGLDEATLARARRTLVRRLEGGTPVTRRAVYQALERANVATAGQRGIHILWRLAHECLVCFGPREDKQQTFVLFDEWLPRAPRLPRDEALAELACRYFTSHGPATLADFAWWSGLNVSDARSAVELARERLDATNIAGDTHWLAPLEEPPRSARAHRAHLLPAFDEFLVGYTDRSAALAAVHTTRVNAGGGILNPTIVVDRRIVGTWKRRLGRGEVVFSPTLFVPLAPAKARAVAIALRRYAGFLGVGVRGDA